MRTLPRILAGSLLALAAAGCGGGKPAAPVAGPRPNVARAPAAAQAVDAGTADQAAAYTYTYNPMGKRDPFRSPVEEVKSAAAGSSVCSEPLCQWDLDQLALVAVVTGDASPIAMVQDPQTRGYIIKRGTKIGKQGGQVTQILRDSVTVTEYFATPDGKRNPNPVTMHLKSDAQLTPELDFTTGKSVQ